jgi:hypothetical protein
MEGGSLIDGIVNRGTSVYQNKKKERIQQRKQGAGLFVLFIFLHLLALAE